MSSYNEHQDKIAAWLDEMEDRRDKYIESLLPDIERVLERDFHEACLKPNDRTLDYMEVDGCFARLISAPLMDIVSELAMDSDIVDKTIECLQKSSCIYVQSLKSVYARAYAKDHSTAMAQNRYDNTKFTDDREIPF